MKGRVDPTKNVSAVDALVISERIAKPRPISMEDPQNLHPKEKVLEVARKKSPETSQNVPLRIIDLGSFEVLSDHGDAEDDGDVDEFSEGAGGIMSPPPPASWLKNTETSMQNEMRCRKV